MNQFNYNIFYELFWPFGKSLNKIAICFGILLLIFEGTITNYSFVGEILKYLIFGCPRLKTLSCIFANYTSVTCINSVIKDMFDINPCQELEIFCFERCLLHESTFYYLLSKLPNIKCIGNLEECFMDREAISRIRDFVKNNNIDVDIDSHKKQCDNVYSILGF